MEALKAERQCAGHPAYGGNDKNTRAGSVVSRETGKDSPWKPGNQKEMK
jgi:hypothetical protein